MLTVDKRTTILEIWSVPIKRYQLQSWDGGPQTDMFMPSSLEPVTVILFGTKVFVDVTKLKFTAVSPTGSPVPGDLPNPGIEPMSLMTPALAGRFFTSSYLSNLR